MPLKTPAEITAFRPGFFAGMDCSMENVRLQALVIEIESYLPPLEGKRNADTLANDCYEAAHYWCGLGHRVLDQDTRVNYPERVRGERNLLVELAEVVNRRSLTDRQEFERLLQAGRELLEIVGNVDPPPDGHFGFLRIVRDQFGFVLKDFGLSVTDEQPTSIRFNSQTVYLELSHSPSPSMSCSFGIQPQGKQDFWIEDLLYLNSDERYKSIPERLDLKTESDIGSWFKFVAEIFKQYGSPILGGSPAAFAALAEAQRRRDKEYVMEMELTNGARKEPEKFDDLMERLKGVNAGRHFTRDEMNER